MTMRLMHSGKVRDVYADGEDLILVASDRVSVFDVVLPTSIPDKGKILTQLSLWWFDQLADIVPNHVISATDVPDEWRGRAIRCRRLDMVQVECVARGYLTGCGLAEYQRGRARSRACRCRPAWSRRPGSPSRSSPRPPRRRSGEHDESMTFDEVVAQEGRPAPRSCAGITLRGVPPRRASWPRERGIIIADTKIEIGRAADGTLVLADEVLTPDSSRFWPADQWQPGQAQHPFDKQMVRDWAVGTGWDKTPPGPGDTRRPRGGDPGPLHRGLRATDRRSDLVGHVYAVTIPEPGGPGGPHLVRGADPEPGPDEVLIEIAASAVNRADLLQRAGFYPPPPGAPPYPGLECSGRIVAVGAT